MSKLSKERRHKSIERRLSKRIHQARIPIGPELRDLLADWSYWTEGRGASSSSSDWFVLFLQGAVKGRAKKFVEWAKAHPSRKSNKALAGIQQVYGFQWPHRATVGYIFHAHWGWLQLELEKPGERQPATIAEQKEALQKHATEQRTPIKEFEIIGGGVFAVMDEQQ